MRAGEIDGHCVTYELWFSESEFSTVLFAQGHQHNAGPIKPDARCIAVIDAESWEDAKRQVEHFLRGPDGFFSRWPNKS